MTTSDWVRAPTPPEAESLAREAREDWPSWLAPVLARRGLGSIEEAEAFLNPSIEQLHDPLDLPDMAAALGRLEEAAERAERVAIVGDYDVDGVSATAMLAAVFAHVGLGVETILPQRLEEGYGFQVAHVERAKQAGCSIVVTADCGSTSYEAVSAALEAGLTVIVTDHHVPGKELGEGALHVNPKLPDSRYPFQELSGAGIAFKLALALAERRQRAIEPERLLRIACLGTIADVVPLVGENRVIASLGLAGLGRTRSPGLQALADVSRTRAPFTATDVGFRLGPRLNAAGRMGSPDPALELLLTRDPARGTELAALLDRLNSDRRQAELLVVDQAREAVQKRAELAPILVASSPEWHKGVVGIAAGRLAREFHRPTVLLSVDGETATGSGRSVPGVELHAFLSGWASELERFGGHSQAIGMTVRMDRLPELIRKWEKRAADSWDAALLAPRYEYDAELTANQVNHDLLTTLSKLEPCGAANRMPLFRLGALSLRRQPRYFGDTHVSLRCGDASGSAFDVVGWRWAEAIRKLPGEFEVLGHFELDNYTGQPVLRLVDARGVGGYS